MAPLLSPTPETLVTRGWSDYALLDSGDGRKLERYGPYTVVRPEPQCVWEPRDASAFDRADAVFDPQDEDDDGRPPRAAPVARGHEPEPRVGL